MKPKFISLEKAGEFLGVSKRTIYRMVAEGELPKWKKIRGRSVFELAVLEAFEGATEGGR